MYKFFGCAIQKSYDALTSVSMLKSRWIAKASSQQRKGRWSDFADTDVISFWFLLFIILVFVVVLPKFITTFWQWIHCLSCVSDNWSRLWMTFSGLHFLNVCSCIIIQTMFQLYHLLANRLYVARHFRPLCNNYPIVSRHWVSIITWMRSGCTWTTVCLLGPSFYRDNSDQGASQRPFGAGRWRPQHADAAGSVSSIRHRRPWNAPPSPRGIIRPRRCSFQSINQSFIRS